MSSKINKQVLAELNLLREDPKKYSLKLQRSLKYYKGKVYHKPGKAPVDTREGTVNVEACITYLSSTRPLPPLKWSDSLYLAAQAHADDIGTKGLMGHNSSDGTEAAVRIGKYSNWSGSLGENIDYGNWTEEDIVMSLIVDDGVLARGQRLNIMNRDHRYAGVAVGYHLDYEYLCVVVFAEEVIDEVTLNEEQSSFSMKKDIRKQRPKLRKMRTKEGYETFEDKIQSSGLTEEEIKDIKNAFDMFDSDSAGTINSDDMKSLLYSQEISHISAFQKDFNVEVNGPLEDMTESSLSMSFSRTEFSVKSQFSGVSSVRKPAKKNENFNISDYDDVRLSQETISDIKRIFDICDENSSGNFDSKVFKSLMESQEIDSENVDLMRALSEIEADDIKFEDFLDLVAEKIDLLTNKKTKPKPKPKRIPMKTNSSAFTKSKPKVLQFDPTLYERDGLSYDEIIEIKEAFDMFDVKNTGTINPNDLKKAMESQGFVTRNSTIFRMVCNMQVSGVEKVNFEEFFTLMTSEDFSDSSKEEIQKLFALFDVDGTGFIDLRNLKKIARELGESLDEQDIMELITKSDLDGDGRVSFEDFYNIMSKQTF